MRRLIQPNVPKNGMLEKCRQIEQAGTIRLVLTEMNAVMLGLLRKSPLGICLSCTLAAAAAAATVDAHDVAFRSQGVTLRGIVMVPKDVRVVAAIVMVHGAGQEKRNLGFATAFAERGIAALTYDKRGVGQSGGVYAGQEVGTNNVSRDNLELLSLDATAALRVLGREKRLRGVPIGFVGVSQAGWIVPLAALKTPQSRFMVLFSGAVETTHEDVRFEYLALADPAFWDHHTHKEMKTLARPPLSAVPGLGATAWSDFDPREALSKLTIPGLWLFGGRDRNADVDVSTERLDGLIAAGHKDYSYRLYPGYDHQLGGINADIIDPSVEWIRRVVSAKP